MAQTNIYFSPNDTKREVDWPELNDLKKDILWIFVENTFQLNAAFVPKENFTKKILGVPVA